MFLIFDANNLVYSGYHAMKDQLTGTAPGNAGLFGFLKTLINRVEQKPSFTGIFVVFDNKGSTPEGLPIPSWRHFLYPEYKANRAVFRSEQDRLEKETIRSDIGAALEELKTVLTFMPVWIVQQFNTEADDLIAALRWKYEQAVFHIVSGDKDMRQLVDPLCSCWLPGRKNQSVTYHNFNQFHGASDSHGTRYEIFNPLDWLVFRVLTGDNSDNIVGLHKVGEVTAAKLLHAAYYLQQQQPDGVSKSGGAYLIRNPEIVAHESDVRGPDRIAKLIKDDVAPNNPSSIINRNFKLMGLGRVSYMMEQHQPAIDQALTPGIFDPNRLMQWLHHKQFNSIIQKFEAFNNMAMRMQ